MASMDRSYLTPSICCSETNVIESKQDPHTVAKCQQRRWNFYKRNKHRKRPELVDRGEQCDETDILRHMEPTSVVARYTNVDDHSPQVNISAITGHTVAYDQQPNARIAGTNCFIERTNENKIRIEISYNPSDTIYIDDLESDTSIDQDSLDEVVVGRMNRERAIDCPGNRDETDDRISPFKRRPPIRQNKNPFKVQANVTKVEVIPATKPPLEDDIDFKTTRTTSSLHRNSILHWSGDSTNVNLLTEPTEKVQKQPFNNFSQHSANNNSLQRNPEHFKKLGVSCQNISSAEVNKTKLNTIKNLNKSKSEFNLKEAVEKESISDRIVKIFKFPKVNKVEPNLESCAAGKSETKANKPNWMKKRIADYFSKRRRSGIQDIDGGFFEKFGSLLQQAEIQHEETILAAVPKKEEIDAIPEEGTVEEPVDDSGIENLSDSGSEHEAGSVDILEDAIGWNLEELYKEILYETLHNIGREDEDLGDSAIFDYLQESFKFTAEKHESLLDEVRGKEAPEICLNVEVIEAKDLKSMDPNGQSDPFVTLYVESKPNQRYNTSVKSGTLSPKWEEHFSLPIPEDPNSENLMIEVWDFDPAETIKEKVNKVFDVKGVKGIRRLIKEIAVTSYAGNHSNELTGKTYIPLKTIPASGIVMWYSLDKKGKTKRTGLLKLRINFSSEKNDHVAMQEHRHLLKILLLHELEKSQVTQYWWSGKYSDPGQAILTQHAAQSGLNQTQVALAKWSVFCDVHMSHPLAFSLFDSLLDKVTRPIHTRTAAEDEVRLFWDSAKKLLPSCFNMIRRLRRNGPGDRNTIRQMGEVVTVLSKISHLKPPEDYNLFPRNLYAWMEPESLMSGDIRVAVADAVRSGTKNWYEHIIEHNTFNEDSNEEKLQHLIKITQLIRSDLQRSREYYDKVFTEMLHFAYTREVYGVYETLLADYIEPKVVKVSKSLKRIHLEDDKSPQHVDVSEINMGTSLFELYLVLKKLVSIGKEVNPSDSDEYKINKYYEWFAMGVSHWLDIALYKAMLRIKKAIELDSLKPIEEGIKRSTSAVDTMAIFNQIKIFWHQLEWPDVEGSYMFIGKIVDDICQCCVFYANKMSERVAKLGDVTTVYEKKFEVTREWCLAINNIEYIRENLSSFVKELGVEKVINNMANCMDLSEVKRCEDTLKNVTENAIDTEKNKILELIETVARKMSPQMQRFLKEGAEVLHEDSNSLDRLMLYMEDSLATLYAELDETNFQRILDAIWTELAIILLDLVQSNLDNSDDQIKDQRRSSVFNAFRQSQGSFLNRNAEKRRPPSFFQNLQKTLKLMVASFKIPGSVSTDTTNIEVLKRVNQLLSMHGLETSELINCYYKERVIEQETMEEAPLGTLTVQAYFKENTLELEIMNARNLRPMDSGGSCDSYVRVNFIPEEKFTSVNKPKTNTQSKTLFPLYDERFSIPLSDEQRGMSDAIIMFCLKDSDLFGAVHRYNCEAFLSFRHICDITADSGKIQQIHLTLNRPAKSAILDSEILKAIELRQGEKQAKEFMKKLKQKIGVA